MRQSLGSSGVQALYCHTFYTARFLYDGSLENNQFSVFYDDWIQLGAKIVYVAGAFDVLHPGHLAFLRIARTLGLFSLHSWLLFNQEECSFRLFFF